MNPDEIRAALEATGATANAADYARSGTHVDVTVPAENLRAAVQALRNSEFLIEDLTAVDASPRLMGLYHFSRIEGGCRVTVRSLTDREAPLLPSIHDIYPGANWHERETHDFYGVVYAGHPDLSPLILPEDSGDLRPLRKSEKKLRALGDVIPLFAPPAPQEADEDSEGEA